MAGAGLRFAPPGPQLRTAEAQIAGFTPVNGQITFMWAQGGVADNDANFAWHSIDTDNGQSGAPLLQAGVPIAIHKEGHGFRGHARHNAALIIRQEVAAWLNAQIGSDNIA